MHTADSLIAFNSTDNRAAAIYKRIAESYSPGNRQEKAQASIDAYLKLWEIYMMGYSDVKSSLNCLNAAKDIASSANITDSRIELNYGLTYESMAFHTNEDELFQKAYKHIENSIHQAILLKQFKTLDTAFRNLFGLAYTMDVPIKNLKYWKEYTVLPENLIDINSRNYNLHLYNGMINLQLGNYDQAAGQFIQQIQETDTSRHRLLINSYMYLANAYVYDNRLDKAIEAMKGAEKIAEQDNSLDTKAAVNMTLHTYHNAAGNPKDAEHYYIKYSHVRDSLLAYSQIMGLKENEFSENMRRINMEINALKYQKKIRGIYLICALILTISAIAAVLIVKNKNKKLRTLNNILYQKNIEILKAEERAKEERRKYQSRSLSEESKDEIMDSLRNVLENDPIIFSSGFSLKDLAEKVKMRPEYISQAINEKTGSGFNEMINTYRIHEACRRITDTTSYGNYTLSAIAESVGIKSPTTFGKFFKSVTGMTPSEFRKRTASDSAV